MMPDMTGFEVCAALKANPRTAHIPVVIVTSLDQAEDRVKGLESGADDFLTKPVSETSLMARVKSLARLKMVTDELELRAAAMQSVGVDAADIFAGGGGDRRTHPRGRRPRELDAAHPQRADRSRWRWKSPPIPPTPWRRRRPAISTS